MNERASSGNDEDRSPLSGTSARSEAPPDLYLVLTPDLKILAASDAYLAALRTDRETIVGRDAVEVLSANQLDPTNDEASRLRDSLGRVARERKPNTMAILRHQVRRDESQGGGFEERFWSPVNTPRGSAGAAPSVSRSRPGRTGPSRLRPGATVAPPTIGETQDTRSSSSTIRPTPPVCLPAS